MTRTRTVEWGSSRTPAGRAFSLVELLLVLAIIGAMAAIAVPRYGQSLTRYRGESAAELLTAEMARAREEARASTTRIALVFTPGSGRVSVARVETDDSLTELRSFDLSRDPINAVVHDANFGGVKRVEFDAWGNAESGGMAVIRVSSGFWSVQIDVGASTTNVSRLVRNEASGPPNA